MEIPTESALQSEVEQLGNEFLAEFYALALPTRPQDAEILQELGHVLTQLGRFEEGLKIDRRLTELAPENPTVLYNLACSLTLCTQSEEAIVTLELAIDAGFSDASLLAGDEDLALLRKHPRFQALLERAGALDEPS